MEGGVTITELYIFNQDDKLLTILTPENGLLTALFRDELNKTSDTPLQFTVDAQAEYSQRHDLRSGMLTQVASSFVGVIDRTTEQDETVNVSPSQFVKEENRVVFKDREGRLREFVIKEIDDINNINGPETTATCIPSFVEELNNKVVVDRRFVDKEAQEALDAALQNTRFNGVVDLSLGKMTTNFYYILSLEAVFKIREVWGGDIRDIVYLSDDETRIERREIRLLPRLGADNGLRFESDHNIEEIQRTILSYPYTALFGRGASLQIEDEEGELTGGRTRYIDFADVEWKKSAGDPVDKPLGQKWVGDPDALQKYGYEKDGELLHLEGIFSNQDYEDKAELLYATWEHLQKVQHPEVNYKLSVDLLDKEVNLGDSAFVIDREFARPIEIQSRIIATEYDLVDIENTTVIEAGQFLNLRDDDLRDDLEDLKDKVNRPERPIDENSYPNRKPSKPINVTATGSYETIQLHWDYADELFIKQYEVYGSKNKDFIPDSQFLLFRGQVSSFAHKVETDEVWYYYIRAVNYHGKPSEYSNRVSATTIRIKTPDIIFGEDMAKELRDLSETAGIIASGTIDWDKFDKELVNVEGNRFKGDLIALDGTSYIAKGVIGTAAIAELAVDKFHMKYGIIDDAHIDYLTGEKFLAKSIVADKLDVTDLSSVSANLGTVTSGMIRSQNYRTEFNLNTGELRMSDADINLYDGAEIRFRDNNNKIRFYSGDNQLYRHNNGNSGGVNFPTSLGTDNPMINLGVSNTSFGINPNSNTFRGIRVHPTGSSHATNMVVGSHMYVLSRANHTNGGFVFRTGYTNGVSRTIYPYDNDNNWTYNLGRSGSQWRWTNIYLKNSPDVMSDISLKENINDIEVGLEFINAINPKSFTLIGDEQKRKNFGIIAQQLAHVLEDKFDHPNNLGILSKGEDGLYGVKHEQFIAPLIRAVQELSDKVEVLEAGGASD